VKTRYRFSHRAGDYYYWVATTHPFRDSRTEHVHCRVDWFWSKPSLFELELRKRGWIRI